MSEQGQEYPVVMRMAGMWPQNIGGFEGHRTREGGDLGHVDSTKSSRNKRLLGTATWAQDVHDEIREMRMANFADELEKLERRRRKKEVQRRLAEGPRDPWRATRHGPMREVILTVNRKWFDDDLTEFLGEEGPTRAEQFEKLAVAWLRKEFGHDCVHARADLDEEAYHIHAVILPRAKTKDGRRMLQPSVHDVIRRYEAGQDSVGDWFAAAEIGLVRGERRKQKVRDALDHNRKVREAEQRGEDDPGQMQPLLEYRTHVTPRKYREAKERELADASKRLDRREVEAKARDQALDRREQSVTAREAEADAVIGLAADVAEGRIEFADDLADSAGPQDGGQPLPPTRLQAARMVFGKALSRLRKRARQKEREKLGTAFRDIDEASLAFARVAEALPDREQKKLSVLGRGLAKAMFRLRRNPDVPKPPDQRE